MELSNINKLSMSIAMAIMSSNYSITRYRIPQARNRSIYEIKSLEDDKSYLIGFDEEKDYQQMFADIMQDVLYERYPKRRIPTADELNDDGLAAKKFVDIVNSFSLDAPDSESMEYATQLGEFNRIAAHMMGMLDIGEELNHLSLETNAIADAIFLVDKTLMRRYSTNDTILLSDLVNTIQTCHNGVKKQRADITNNFPWVTKPIKKDIDYNLEKDIAKTLTYNIVFKDLSSIIRSNENLANTLFFDSIFVDNNQEMEFTLHDRESLADEFKEYRDNLYSGIMARNGFTDPDNFAPDIKESLTFAILKDNKKPYTNYLGEYLNLVENQKINFGLDQRILGAVALNIMSLYGLEDSLINLTDLEKYNNLEISQVFEKHYNMIRENPTLSYQLARKLKNSCKKPKTDIIEDYLKEMYPDVEFKSFDLDGLDDLPDFIKDMLEDFDKDNDNYDPTIEEPYPDDEDMEI